MKTTSLFAWFIVAFLSVLSGSGCREKDNDDNGTPSDTWDLDVQGIPQFVKVYYIHPDQIYRISKFRSSVGHDYSDAFEHCRSMKHYAEPKASIDWSTIPLYSPVKGKFTRVEQEWAGTKLEIVSDSMPAFRFSVFHVQPAAAFTLGQAVEEGEYLGNHIGAMTMSDISVIVNDPTRQGRMVSYFELLTDNAFNLLKAYGIHSRQELIITKAERDAHPLSCSGDVFTSADSLESWVVLQ